MSEATPAQGTNTAPDSVQRLTGQVRLLLWGIAACLILILAAASVGLYYEIGVLDKKVSTLQRSLNEAQADLGRVKTVLGGSTTGIVALLRAQAATETSLARIEAVATKASAAKAAASQMPAPQAAAPKAGPPDDVRFAVNASETAALRSYFKLTPKVGAPAQYKMGDTAPAAAVKSIPADAAAKIAPQLQGTNYLIDKNGALVVTAGADNAVVLIIAPS